jgi:hypothetical protein
MVIGKNIHDIARIHDTFGELRDPFTEGLVVMICAVLVRSLLHEVAEVMDVA